jgi:inositol oxygenase
MSSVVVDARVAHAMSAEPSEEPEVLKPHVPTDADKQEGDAYRNYVDGKHQTRVERFYATKYRNQTYAYACKMKEQYANFAASPRPAMTAWEAAEFLNTVVDESDPDADFPQIYHCFQTGEACRKACPDLDWFHLLGFMHDLGKVLASPTFGGVEQWACVGDTFPVGCAVTDANVLYHHWAATNPDAQDARLNTELGVYSEGCGFEQVTWAWGHDEYLYMVLRNHAACILPEEALYCVRFHSLYPWHARSGYRYLANEKDMKMLPWVQRFQKCDLYSKSDDPIDIAALTPYYRGLMEKYVPGIIQW